MFLLLRYIIIVIGSLVVVVNHVVNELFL